MSIYKKIKRNYTEAKKESEKGFVILIAVVVASLLVSIGFFISDISQKEILFSVSGKESQIAFYVADTVMECALYQDLQSGSPFDYDSFTLATTNTSTFSCLKDESQTITFTANGQATTTGAGLNKITTSGFTSKFSVDTGSSGRDVEAHINVKKTAIGTSLDETVIEVRGFNHELDSNNPFLLERALKATY